MDIRQQTRLAAQSKSTSSSSSAEKDQRIDIKNITNIAVYNLMKRKSVYNELIGEFQKQAKFSLTGSSSYITIYSYKPAVYLVVAALAHMQARTFSFSWAFVHVSALLLINHWDMNQGAKKINPTKWQQYQEAARNYQLALSMQKISAWGQIQKIAQQKLKPSDYEKVLRLKPH